ncbi:hypothetical protein [Lentibacillus daqui]|uniref:hypothetical protein n=1 Tax=Lentibacillus daqui TaxID=2911514 RepID=UPI0022B0C8BB|nr:hypothetical protein [Lentibacillus daqui]
MKVPVIGEDGRNPALGRIPFYVGLVCGLEQGGTLDQLFTVSDRLSRSFDQLFLVPDQLS